jgi:hypothetical protein
VEGARHWPVFRSLELTVVKLLELWVLILGQLDTSLQPLHDCAVAAAFVRVDVILWRHIRMRLCDMADI